MVAAHEVQAEVDARGDAGRGEHVALVDVEDAGIDGDRGIALGQLLGVGPVRGGPPAVEQAGVREDEGAGADRGDARAARVGRPQRVEHLCRRRPLRRAQPGTSTVSASASASRPRGTSIAKPVVVGTRPARAPHAVKA